MSVSKRLRYEVLRRDNHSCRYCGATATDAKLTIDHVVPVALGGTDQPDNLVAACQDCNTGKTSSNPDAQLIEQVTDDAIRWGRAMGKAAEMMLADSNRRSALHDEFLAIWNGWGWDQKDGNRLTIPLDNAWRSTVDRLIARGLPMPVIRECVQVAMTRTNLPAGRRFRYFCGVAWKKVEELTGVAKELYAPYAPESNVDVMEVRLTKPDLRRGSARWYPADRSIVTVGSWGDTGKPYIAIALSDTDCLKADQGIYFIDTRVARNLGTTLLSAVKVRQTWGIVDPEVA